MSMTGVLALAAVKLMFGGADTEAGLRSFLDYEFVTPEDARFSGAKAKGYSYDERQGYCWQFYLARYASSLPPDNLTAHSVVVGEKAVLTIPFAGETAYVHMHLGDWSAGFGFRIAQLRKAGKIRIRADGKTVYEATPDADWCYRNWTRLEDYVYSKRDPAWDRLVKPVLEDLFFEVPVKDGRVAIEMERTDLTALEIAASEEELKAVLAETERARRAEFARRYPWKPKADEPMPRTVAKGARAVMFQRDPMDSVYPWSRPSEAELTDSPRAFAARGEQEPIRFGVIPTEDFAKLEVEIGDFRGPDGALIRIGEQADFWRERYREVGGTGQRGLYTKMDQLDPRSHILQDYAPQPGEAGTPRMYILDVRVPRDAKSGDYVATLAVKGDGETVVRGRLVLKVLPFVLRRDGAAEYGFQATYGDTCMTAPTGRDPAKVRCRQEEYIRFLTKYGFAPMEFNARQLQGSFGKITGPSGNRKVEITPEQEANWAWWFRQCDPRKDLRYFIIRGQDLFTACGWPMKLMHDSRHYFRDKPADFTPEVRRQWEADLADMADLVGQFDRFLRSHAEWPEPYWYFVGELDNRGARGVEEESVVGDLIRKAGAKSFVNINGPLAAKAVPGRFDLVCANGGAGYSEELRNRVVAGGRMFGAHNCGDERFQVGFHFWRSGGSAYYQETVLYCDFARPLVFLPWNYCTALAFPGSDGRYRPTVPWISYRDGVDDYLYLHTLERDLADGLGTPQARRAAEDFLAFLKEKIKFDPRAYHAGAYDAVEGTCKTRRDEWNGTSIERYRWCIAGLIAALRQESGRNNP